MPASHNNSRSNAMTRSPPGHRGRSAGRRGRTHRRRRRPPGQHCRQRPTPPPYNSASASSRPRWRRARPSASAWPSASRRWKRRKHSAAGRMPQGATAGTTRRARGSTRPACCPSRPGREQGGRRSRPGGSGRASRRTRSRRCRRGRRGLHRRRPVLARVQAGEHELPINAEGRRPFNGWFDGHAAKDPNPLAACEHLGADEVAARIATTREKPTRARARTDASVTTSGGAASTRRWPRSRLPNYRRRRNASQHYPRSSSAAAPCASSSRTRRPTRAAPSTRSPTASAASRGRTGRAPRCSWPTRRRCSCPSLFDGVARRLTRYPSLACRGDDAQGKRRRTGLPVAPPTRRAASAGPVPVPVGGQRY